MDLTEEVSFKDSLSSNGSTVKIEFQGKLQKGLPRYKKVDDGIVRDIEIVESKSGYVVIQVKKADAASKYAAFVLPRVDGRPVRLILDIEGQGRTGMSSKERGQMHSRPTVPVGPRKAEGKTVVIDPGHGGEDPGAIGIRGVKEKEVVLSLARHLKDELQSQGVNVFLTRTGDYFIPLRERVKLAHEHGADLFVSIHADSSPTKTTRGASVYCLSLTGATDEAARILAEKENASDLIGGVRLSDDKDLNFILVDLVQTETINQSLKFGSVLLEAMRTVHEIKFQAPKQAGFRVLKAPDIPSVLIETGFLSNPQEELLLAQSSFQKKLARALADGIMKFLGLEPKKVAAGEPQRGRDHPMKKASSNTLGVARRVHVVQKGQSLSHIAAQYGVSIRELKEANGIQEAKDLKPGQRILIP